MLGSSEDQESLPRVSQTLWLLRTISNSRVCLPVRKEQDLFLAQLWLVVRGVACALVLLLLTVMFDAVPHQGWIFSSCESVSVELCQSVPAEDLG